MIARVVVLIASLCGITHGAELGTLGRVTYYDQSGHTVPRERVCDIEPTPARGLTALHEHMYYPPWERSLRIGGVVRVLVSLDSTGNIVDTSILESARPKFDNIVLNGVRKTRWKPAAKNGHAVPVKFSFTVHFV